MGKKQKSELAMQPVPQTVSQPVQINVHLPTLAAGGAGYPSPPPYSYPQSGYPGPFAMPTQLQQSQQAQNQQYLTGWMNGNLYNYLQNATSFHVKQKVDFADAVLCKESDIKYSVKDQAGHNIFYVGEESNVCGRLIGNARRQFSLTVNDGAGQTVFIISRSLDCSCCCGFFFPDKLIVTTPSGQMLGSVTKEFNMLRPSFNIKDTSGKTVLNIRGPFCPCNGSVVFSVTNLRGKTVGSISKDWSGFTRELFTDADYSSISFPFDLEPAVKAVCLAALFLIDCKYLKYARTNDHK